MTTPETYPQTYPFTDRYAFPSLCWGAILGGTVAAIGIHLLLTALGVGAGLAVFTPMQDPDPVASFNLGAAVIWNVCALIALGFGSVVAGRFSHSVHSGFMHGVLVWSVTLILMVLLLSLGTGLAMGGALKVLGEGLGIGGKAVASATGGITQEATQRNGDQLKSFIDEASQSISTNTAPGTAVRNKRELGFAITKFFAPGYDINDQANRDAAAQALQTYGGMSQADAAKTVNDWVDSYKALQAELQNAKAVAENKAREAADRAARNLSRAAMWSFGTLCLGLLVSAMCGSLGARRALDARAYATSSQRPIAP